jgi:cytochrome c oxidase assembly protein subunit 15
MANRASTPRWLHAWAVLTVLVTLPLLFLGAEVTTKDVGMADPQGYRHPWELVQALAESVGFGGLQIEYSHRVAGFTVGICAIVLVAGLWLFERRRWVCWAAMLALALICVQGLLGIFRVNLNELYGRSYAMIHGCFAQLVIAALVSIALFTSRSWTQDHADTPASPGLRRWSLLTVLLVYGQLVLGSLVRHRDFQLGSRLHVLGAFVVLGAVLWLIKLTWESDRRTPLAFSVKVLIALVGLQIMLGTEAWLGRAMQFYLREPGSMASDWIRSAHYVAGTMIFATSVVIAWKANRRPIVVEGPAVARTLEGAL